MFYSIRTLIQAHRYVIQLPLRVAGHVPAFRDVLSQQSIGVLVRAALRGVVLSRAFRELWTRIAQASSTRLDDLVS